jgi:hypothetical protein
MQQLEKTKPVIICGDLNVCHRPIDIARPEANYNKSAGYTQKEIDGIDNLLQAGYIDTFRSPVSGHGEIQLVEFPGRRPRAQCGMASGLFSGLAGAGKSHPRG